MGSGIAENLLRNGVDLQVHDKSSSSLARFEALGAIAKADIAELKECTIVFVCLPGPPEFQSVVCDRGGLIDVLQPGSLIIDMTTNRVSTVREAAQLLQTRGIELADAPVSGGVPGSVEGTLAVAVGGSVKAYERAEPFLKHVSGLLIHAGEIGAGDACKLVHNMGLHIVRQALAEMFTVAAKAGVKPADLFEFVSAGSFGRLDHLHAWLKPRVFTGKFETEEAWFRHALSLKDIKLVDELASELDVPSPLGRTCLDIAQEATNRGWDDRDSWIVFALQEEAAGIKVRSD